MDGIINVYKEKGYTSHDVVARVRGITGIRHIGHTGTLDPEAEGVLPICIGTATKLCDMLTDKTKVYEAVLLLGVQTDTQDASGYVTGEAQKEKLDSLSDEEIDRVLKSFEGEYDQLPPMFSAVRVNGQRLYSAARAGREVEREARKVSISCIERTSDIVHGSFGDIAAIPAREGTYINSFGTIREEGHWQRVEKTRMERDEEKIGLLPVIRLCLRVECSKGTYVRTLCNDIGERLGVYGCVEKLLRVRVGEFVISDTVTLSEIEAVKESGIEKLLKPADACFGEYTRLDTKPKYDSTLINGNVLYFRHFSQYITQAPSPVRVYTSTGKFAAVYEFDQTKNRYTPLKMFVSEEEIREWNEKAAAMSSEAEK